MVGIRKGLCSLAIKQNPLMRSFHCMLHREALASRKLQPSLGGVLEHVIRMVNSIESKALQTRKFRAFCEEHDAKYPNLLYHSSIHLLSEEQVLKRVYELKEEFSDFFTSTGSEWLAQLCYLNDVFQFPTDLNLSLRNLSKGDITLIHCYEKITSFNNKLAL